MSMRFLFQFVSCCVPINRSFEKISPPHPEEMRSLVPETTRKHRRRRRNAANSTATVIADWKPSLGAIAEDKVVVVVMEREKTGDPTVEIKRKSGSREPRLHHDRNNLGRSPGAVPVVIPAFSPTPFLF